MTQRERQVLQLIESDPLISQQDIAKKLGITRSSVAVHISNLTKKGCIAGRGYVLRSGSYAVVVGGVNVDIGGPLPRWWQRTQTPAPCPSAWAAWGGTLPITWRCWGRMFICSAPMATMSTASGWRHPVLSWAST